MTEIRKRHSKEASSPEDRNQLKEQYASLKLAAENSGDKQLAAEFNFWQLYFSKTFPSVNWLYYHTSRYGLDYVQPVRWIIILGIITTMLYAFLLEPSLSFRLGCWFECNGKDAYNLSFGAATFGFDPFKLTKYKSVWTVIFIPIIYFLQKSASFFLWFEFGKAIRHRIRI